MTSHALGLAATGKSGRQNRLLHFPRPVLIKDLAGEARLFFLVPEQSGHTTASGLSCLDRYSEMPQDEGPVARAFRTGRLLRAVRDDRQGFRLARSLYLRERSLLYLSTQIGFQRKNGRDRCVP